MGIRSRDPATGKTLAPRTWSFLMTDRAEILIARAGAAGLGAARRLDEAAHADWRLYKVEAAAGGPAGGVVSVHAAPQVTRALSPMRRGFPAVPAGRASLP